MVQSPSCEANWFAANQEIPRISRNPKVHYRTHKRPPPVSIVGQPNAVHIPTSHLLEIRPNIIHPSTPRSPQWSPSLRFPQQEPIHPPPLLTHKRHMPNPSHYKNHNTIVLEINAGISCRTCHWLRRAINVLRTLCNTEIAIICQLPLTEFFLGFLPQYFIFSNTIQNIFPTYT